VLAAGILGLGYFGPHPSARPPTTGASPSASPQPSTIAAAETATPAPSAGPTGDGPQLLEAITGLTQVARVPGETITWLPLEITSHSFAIVGKRLFYIVAGDRIESSVLGSGADPQTLVVAARCHNINQLAAAGNYLLYVETFDAPPATTGGCDGFGLIGWSLQLLDLGNGSTRNVAGGTRQTRIPDVAEYPIHIALTDTAYAFDRPNAASDLGGGETVEVHSIDGATLWTSPTDAHVADVMLGGARLGVLTEKPWPAFQTRILWVSDAAHPELREVAEPASSGSLSQDGAYVSWDLRLHLGPNHQTLLPNLGVAETATGMGTFLDPPTTADLQSPARPMVSNTSKGPILTWFATAPDGTVYPAFRWLQGGGSGFLESVQEPVWIAVENSTLIWVSEGRDGWSTVAFEADLTSL
jgi:hypothetical protein